MIKHIKINSENLQLAIEIENKIFPDMNAKINYEQAISGENDFNYFIVYDGDKVIGVSGIYHIGADFENAWLGWFGILPEERRKSYGSEALKLLEETARDLGYRYMRVLINKNQSDPAAMTFLTVNGYIAEFYDNPRDSLSQKGNFVILSRSFYQEKVPTWNNKNIHITDSLEAQKNYQ